MSYQFTISDIGLRLIKAYEGYAPEGRVTRDGRKIIGYGRLTGDKDLSVSLEEAESLLKLDLLPIEDLINTNVHAAMSQSQFDAMCSLAYSIGPDAFLSSDVLHALNKGEVIAAANGFDSWRLGNIDGKIYMVDALVRRRTAEKALFLRPMKRVPPAPHDLLRALPDDRKTTEYVSPLGTTGNIAKTNVVQLRQDNTPQEITLQQDSDVYELTDIVDEPTHSPAPVDATDEVTEAAEKDSYTSPIAEAAAEVSGRLDALMERPVETPVQDWPDSLVEGDPEPLEFDFDNQGDPAASQQDEDLPKPISIYETVVDGDYQPGVTNDNFDSAGKYIEPGVPSAQRQNFWAFVTMIILGVSAAAGGLWATLRSNAYFGDLSPLVWSAAVAIGVLMSLMGLYYLLKHLFGKH